MVRGGVKDRSHARGLLTVVPHDAAHRGDRRGSLTPPRWEVTSCAAPTMALAHVHTARHFSFSASSDGLLLWLSEECRVGA